MKKQNLKKTLLIGAAVSVPFEVLIFIFDVRCGVLTLCLTVLLFVLFALFEKSRARTIEGINDYLSLVCMGNYSLDISDNCEGELSILKNNIYKVVVMFKTTNEALSREKLSLASSLADITHQLKTPLTSITVMTDLLENEPTDEKRREFTGIIKAQADKMNWLTATLLKLSRLDADAVSFDFAPVKISEVIKASIKPFLLEMDVKGISFSEKYEDFEFNGDFAWTAEAIKNIIKNCTEHTPAGGELKITTEKTNLYNELIISDNGEGVDECDLPHIFERFYHGKNASADSVGIGLNLAKEILSKEKATVSVQSEKGVGTAFIIRFYKCIV